MTLTLCRFSTLRARLWAFAQMGLARPALRRMAGLEFHKLMGSGTGEGFTPVPNTAVWAILAVWSDDDAARSGLRTGPFAAWARQAAECCHIRLAPRSARGLWAGRAPFAPGRQDEAAPPDEADAAPIAILTRATVRPSKTLRFWRRVPDISMRIGADADVRLKIGVGEVPWLHQVTFSIWPDAAAMARFARTGPHADAIRAVRDGDWFSEELYARFRVTGMDGTWQGRSAREVLT